MSELKKSDFAYGAAISALMSNGIYPTLVSSGKRRNIYKISVNNKECELYIKRSSISNNGLYDNWIFNIEKELDELNEYLSSGKKFFILLVCIVDIFSKGELVIINSDELKALLETGKKNITISRQRTGEYMISTGRKKDEYINIRYNRFNELK